VERAGIFNPNVGRAKPPLRAKPERAMSGRLGHTRLFPAR